MKEHTQASLDTEATLLRVEATLCDVECTGVYNKTRTRSCEYWTETEWSRGQNTPTCKSCLLFRTQIREVMGQVWWPGVKIKMGQPTHAVKEDGEYENEMSDLVTNLLLTSLELMEDVDLCQNRSHIPNHEAEALCPSKIHYSEIFLTTELKKRYSTKLGEHGGWHIKSFCTKPWLLWECGLDNGYTYNVRLTCQMEGLLFREGSAKVVDSSSLL